MARNRNKYSRARVRAKVRRPKRRGGARWYYGALALILGAGFAGIALSAGGSSATPPRIGDHWHSSLAVNVCGEWLGPPGEFLLRAGTSVESGLHTHTDGFMHIEPGSSADAGDNATLGRFFENGGWTLSTNSLDLWQGPAAQPSKSTWSNGDECPAGTTMAGRNGTVKWSVDCVGRTGDPSEYKLRDLHVVAVGFLPKGEAIGVPPNATSVVPDGAGGNSLDVKSCATSGPGGESPPAPIPTTTTTSASTTP